MIRSYKYRLYPTDKQSKALVSQLNGHRFLYNSALAQKKETYEQTGKGLGSYAQAKGILPRLRRENEDVALCNCSSLQQTLRRLEQSFSAFFRRIKAGEKAGYPRFKSADRFHTIGYPVLGNGCQIKENLLYLQNVGCIKVKWHRPIDGNIKNLFVISRNGKWYVCFAVEVEADMLPETGKQIGIDVGLSSFLTTSDGQQIPPPKFFKKGEKKLAKAQRVFYRRKKGSHRRRKARFLVAKHHEKIANQRLDFCHKVVHSLVQEYDGFAVESLNIKYMVKNKYLANSISDAGWGMFLLILKAKAESAGREYHAVNPRGTSQECSCCGNIVRKSLVVRVHNCSHCGLSLNRDVNAARNIKARMVPSLRGGVVMPLVEARSCLL